MTDQSLAKSNHPAAVERRWNIHRLATGKPEPTPYIDHWILQLHGVDTELIASPDGLMPRLTGLIERLRLTQVSHHFHHFDPGVSAVIILSESHLSIHTWPEIGFLHADIVTCVEKITASNLHSAFSHAFSPSRIQIDQLDYRSAPAGGR